MVVVRIIQNTHTSRGQDANFVVWNYWYI